MEAGQLREKAAGAHMEGHDDIHVMPIQSLTTIKVE